MHPYVLYLTVGCDEKYIEMLELCLKSVFLHSTPLFDVFILTDPKLFEQVRKRVLLLHCTAFTIYIVDEKREWKDASDAQKKRYHMTDFFKQKMYEKVLYMDSDMIVTYDIYKLFLHDLKPNTLYVYQERFEIADHNSAQFRLFPYTQTQLDNMKANGIYPFNSGLLLACNDAKIVEHFDHVKTLANQYPGAPDQSILNHYFNNPELDVKLDYSLIHNKIVILYNPEYDTLYRNHFVHFCGSFLVSRVELMKKYLKRIETELDAYSMFKYLQSMEDRLQRIESYLSVVK